MASVRRKAGSKYWFACFTRADGSRTQQSTKETDRKKAQRLADTFEEAAKLRITAKQAQRVISDVFQRAMGASLPSTSIRDYFESWLNRKKAETAPNTFIFYNGKARRFLKWLGPRAEHQLLNLTSANVLAFRASELDRVNSSSVNHAIKFLRMVFEDAKREGHIADNPADGVKVVRRNGERSRRPFTKPEIKSLVAAANDEWRSLILFGAYTGQRLGDLARLKRSNLDLETNELRLITSKTGRQQIIPIAVPLRKHIETLRVGDNPSQPLHPSAFRSVTKSQKVSTLSRQFSELMVRTGLAAPKKHRKSVDCEGRDGRRKMSELSFHSLRHTATSLMKNAGVPAAIVQDIMGHESAAISANYTHIDDATKRAAIEKMPDLVAEIAPTSSVQRRESATW